MTPAELRYDWVLFDVGETLIGFLDWYPFQAFLSEAGLPAAEEDARELLLRLQRTLASVRDQAQGLGADEAALEAWWRGNFRLLWPGRPDVADRHFDWFRADRFDRVFPDVVPALAALRRMGLRLGVISNFSGSLENLLGRLGLRDYFEFVIVSSLVGFAKPDPRIFDLAVQQAGAPRDRILYVGDHLGDDVEGARGAGLDAVLVDRKGSHRGLPQGRIGSLLDLPAYVLPSPLGRG